MDMIGRMRLLCGMKAVFVIGLCATTALSAQPTQVDVCEVIWNPIKYDGKLVEFFGYRSADIEMLLINGARCRDRYVVISESVTGSFKTMMPEVSGNKWLQPSGVFRGTIRVEPGYRGGEPSIFLENGHIVSSGLTEFPLP
jgi:hypothetical protein